MPSDFHRMIGRTHTDTTADVIERIVNRAAGEMANREMMTKFAPLTAENAGDAMEWQAARIKDLKSQKIAKIQIVGHVVRIYHAATNADLGDVPLMPRKPRNQERPTLRATLEAFCASIGYTLDAPVLR